ncbi:hypothetical protein MATL_G00255610 [Megalops atlanticus]|uniref:Uncharacterized protein n=1 Tax=Megalops atlanticus TaxID=7932 RepID=A0A9D3T0D4_MEGAT|nr:hypothetical protein MATL_G00255610 [Megalops atlanticus]
MSNISTFHTQLSSIMEVLANAAVAEICELVDNGYAVLHLEISRSQKENKALKKKLHMLELRIARESDERESRETSVKSCSETVKKCEESRHTIRMESHFPVAARATGSQSGIGLWRGGQPTAVTDEDETVRESSEMEPTADKEELRPESVRIKEEKLEEYVENCDSEGALKITEDRAVESGSDGGDRASIADTQTGPAVETEELTEQNRTRHSVWEDGGLDTTLKAEPENDTKPTRRACLFTPSSCFVKHQTPV